MKGLSISKTMSSAIELVGKPSFSNKIINYWEINEAFAAQFLAVNRDLKLDLHNVNRHGSGISLRHPAGATGARLLVTLLHELKRSGERYGCATLCAGGGPGAAMIVENMQL
ncbi:hypothetical protein [Alteribacillus bidgolensis]|uniref:hypothetical protein n=1 Tax=Alteribacillus bidgolensis TaxID=930129 RepID=UPI001FEA6294|nr:hypothetical protein [Alteribacillus bidgolensis]